MGGGVGSCARNGPLDRWRPGRGVLVPGSLLVQPVLRLGRTRRRGADLARERQQGSLPPRLRGIPSRSRRARGRLFRHHPGRVDRLQELQDRHAVRRRVRPHDPLRALRTNSGAPDPRRLVLQAFGLRGLQCGRVLHVFRYLLDFLLRSSVSPGRRYELGLPNRARLRADGGSDDRRLAVRRTLVARSGPRLPMTVGCVLAGIGIILTEMVLTPSSGLSTLGWTLPIAGAGFGIAIVPVTSTALSSLPAQNSGMAASATNTSRELGAVAGVAVLGSMVNGQLISSLVRQLNLIGIPKSFQDTVITAVTTGTFSSQAKQFKGTPAITKIVNEVTQAAYVAFGHGLDAALSAAGAMMLACGIVAALTMRVRIRTSAALHIQSQG